MIKQQNKFSYLCGSQNYEWLSNLQQHFTDFLQWADVYFVIVNNKH